MMNQRGDVQQAKERGTVNTWQIHVFISHSWAHSGHYETLAQWIKEGNWQAGPDSLIFLDYSVPKDDPIHNAPNSTALRQKIREKIGKSHVVVIPTGMYATFSKWINEEIAGANAYGKPILAVNLWGSVRHSSVVGDAAQKTVGWNQKSVVNGIWELFKQ